MEKDFQKNFIKKGDTGFVYDKKVDFSKKQQQAADASWDEEQSEDQYSDDF